MNPYKKCTKLASVLDTLAEKLRDPNIGMDLWDNNEQTMRDLINQLLIILNSAAQISNSPIKILEEEWPEIIFWDKCDQ